MAESESEAVAGSGWGSGSASVLLVRHGETEWSRSGRHTSTTDIPLTPEGEDQARALAPFFSELSFDLVLCSPRQRARRTAELAGLTSYEVVDDLQEWDYGSMEGRTTAEIQADLPGWSIWDGPWKGGETDVDVAARAHRLLSRVRSSGDEGVGRVILVGHGHFSRVIGASWVGGPVAAGRWLDLGTATWSELGWDRGSPVVSHWNVPVL